jgi:predicted PurR-regulated permease PerM
MRPERSESLDRRPLPGPLDRFRRAPEGSVEHQRVRLLAGLTLIAGVALLLGLPFALRAGAEFFLPVTAAMVIAIALVPLLEWLERRRVPPGIAAFVCLFVFLVIANAALASIVVPATEWFRALPERIPQIQANLAPLIDFYSNLQRFVDDTVQMLASGPVAAAQASAVEAPSSIMDYVSSAPHAAIQLFFAILVVYFFLCGWTRLRERTITSRGSFGGALATARVIQNVVDSTSAYLGTITAINVTLGLLVAVSLWAIGMPSPLMWGGIVALCNYVPYIGPILAAILLALGGLMTFSDVWLALTPAAIQIALHFVEANAVTPAILSRRLTINPLLILLSLSFWGWVWGTPGALLAVPLLIIIQTVVAAAGKPDIAGFLFEEGTLVAGGPPENEQED